MNTFLGISGSLSEKDVDTEALEAADMLYLEGYLCTSPTARDAVIHARELAERRGIRTVASLSDPSVVQFFGEEMRAMLGSHVDHLFCNEEEALAWTGASTLEEAFSSLKDFAGSFAITRGAEGSLLGTAARATPWRRRPSSPWIPTEQGISTPERTSMASARGGPTRRPQSWQAAPQPAWSLALVRACPWKTTRDS